MSLPSSSMVEPDQQAKDRTTEGEANTSAGAAPVGFSNEHQCFEFSAHLMLTWRERLWQQEAEIVQVTISSA